MTTADTPLLVDTHAHIDFDDFAEDRAELMQRASAVGVKHIFVPAVTQQTWPQTIKVCQRYACCELALGLHPVFIDQHQPQHLTELDEQVAQHKPIAIGEIGLDFFSKELQAQKEKQIAFFTKQLIKNIALKVALFMLLMAVFNKLTNTLSWAFFLALVAC